MGWKPVPLNATGRAQIEQLAERLTSMSLQAVYTSPLQRTMESAMIVATPHTLSPIPDERWIETKITGWEGRLWTDLDEDPIREHYYTRPAATRLPDGEMLTEVQQRTVAAAMSLVEKHPDGCVAIVSHADPIRTVVSHFIGLDLCESRQIRIEHGSLTLLEIEHGVGTLRLLNSPPETVRLPSP